MVNSDSGCQAKPDSLNDRGICVFDYPILLASAFALCCFKSRSAENFPFIWSDIIIIVVSRVDRNGANYFLCVPNEYILIC